MLGFALFFLFVGAIFAILFVNDFSISDWLYKKSDNFYIKALDEINASRAIDYCKKALKYNIENAYAWYELGNIWSSGKSNLGRKRNTKDEMFRNKNGTNLVTNSDEIEANYVQAIYYWERAAELDCIPALKCIAEAYWVGQGVEKDSRKVSAIYGQITEKKGKLSDELLRRWAAIASVTEKDYKKVFDCYNKIENKTVLDLVNIGDCYRRGRGVEKNVSEAVNYYQLALEKDTQKDRAFQCMRYIGDIKRIHTKGGRTQYGQALAWYTKACKNFKQNAYQTKEDLDTVLALIEQVKPLAKEEEQIKKKEEEQRIIRERQEAEKRKAREKKEAEERKVREEKEKVEFAKLKKGFEDDFSKKMVPIAYIDSAIRKYALGIDVLASLERANDLIDLILKYERSYKNNVYNPSSECRLINLLLWDIGTYLCDGLGVLKSDPKTGFEYMTRSIARRIEYEDISQDLNIWVQYGERYRDYIDYENFRDSKEIYLR